MAQKKNNVEKFENLVKKSTRFTKTNHEAGWHKSAKNPTTNYRPDSHKKFCERCLMRYHDGVCPVTGKTHPSTKCSL